MTAAPGMLRPLVVASIFAEGKGQAGSLTLVDLATGRQTLDAAPGPCRHPVLSPGARQFLAFDLGGDVALASLMNPRASLVVLAPALPAHPGLQTFQFDATGSWIAVAVPSGILVLPTSPSVGDGRRIGLPVGLEPAHIVWSERGRTLAVSARSADQVPVTLWFDAPSGQLLSRADVSEALALPDDQTLWTVEPAGGRPAGQASVTTRSGFAAGAFVCPEDRMILGWLPRRHEVMMSAFADDAGDDADVVVAPVSGGGGEPRPLIQGLRGVQAITPSPDGAWVAVLLEEDPQALHLLATEGGDSVRVPLPAPVMGEDDEPLVVSEAVCGPALSGSASGPWR